MREDTRDLETEERPVWLGGSQRVRRAMGRKAEAQSGRTLQAVKECGFFLGSLDKSPSI